MNQIVTFVKNIIDRRLDGVMTILAKLNSSILKRCYLAEQAYFYLSRLETLELNKCQFCIPVTSAAIPSSSTFDLCNKASEIKVNAKIAGKIADCIGQRWQLLAFELDVDQPTLDKIIDNNPRNTEKAITDMLMHCVNKRQGDLTLKEVEECIKRVGVNINWEKFKDLYQHE